MGEITPSRACVKPKENRNLIEQRVKVSEWRVPSTGLSEWTSHVLGQHAAYAVSDRQQAEQLAKLASFRELRPDWDTYGAEPPSEIALNNASRILRIVWQYGGARIRLSPSVEGGVGIIFMHALSPSPPPGAGGSKRYADIECFNDGEILAITSDGPEPSVWTVDASEDSFRTAIDRIIAFLNG